jgi:hypothetical protein
MPRLQTLKNRRNKNHPLTSLKFSDFELDFLDSKSFPRVAAPLEQSVIAT